MEKKTYKDGYAEGVRDAINIIKEAERNPKDMTRLSLLVTRKLQGLKEYDHGCN